MRLRRRATRLLGRFVGDRSGLSATELALIMPVMIPIYFAAVDFGDGFTVKRSVTHAASAIGDLITQSKELSAADMQSIFAAADAIIEPYLGNRYNPQKLRIVVSQVKIDDDGKATIVWSASRGDGATAPAKGADATLPDEVKSPGEYVITADVQYDFPLITTSFFKQPIPFSERFYLKPRVSQSVEYPKT